jgi:hypothetical protein
MPKDIPMAFVKDCMKFLFYVMTPGGSCTFLLVHEQNGVISSFLPKRQEFTFTSIKSNYGLFVGLGAEFPGITSSFPSRAYDHNMI